MKVSLLRSRTAFFYALTAFPLAMLGLPLYIYLPTFYADFTPLSITAVGIILFVSRLTDMVSDPLIGWYSDRFESRFGRRKPFLAAGSLLLIISFYALINPPQEHTAVWLLLFSVLVYLGWSLVSIPYLAWSAEISQEYHDKTRLSAAREFITILGAMSALILPYLYGLSEDASESMKLIYPAIVVTLIPFTVITLSQVEELPLNHSHHHNQKKLTEIWKNLPGLKRLQSAFLINSLANALPATLFLFYIDLVIGFSNLTGPLLIAYFASGVIALPFWTALAKRIGKRNSWLVSIILASTAFVFVPLLGHGDIIAFSLIVVISGFSLGADMALPSSMQADVAQQVQEQGKDYTGILFGVWAMLTKFSLAMAVGIGFVLLGISGFDPDHPTQLSLLILSLLYGGLPVLLKLIGFFIMRGYHEDT